MSQPPAPAHDDPEQLAEALKLWTGFTQLAKWSVVTIAAALLVLAASFLYL